MVIFVLVLTRSHHSSAGGRDEALEEHLRRSQDARRRSGHILLVRSHGIINATLLNATRHSLWTWTTHRNDFTPAVRKRAFQLTSPHTLASARLTPAEWRVVQSQGSGQSNLSVSRDARRYAPIRRAACTFPLARAAHFTFAPGTEELGYGGSLVSKNLTNVNWRIRFSTPAPARELHCTSRSQQR